MKFADFYVGQIIKAGPYAVSEDEVRRFAEAYDPQWFHTDPKAAARGRFGGLIASGWHTCAIAMRLAVDAALKDSESFASPGVAYIKWLAPVRPGDRLSLMAEIVEKRRSASKPTLGVLVWRLRLINQDGVEAMEFEATSLFDLAASEQAL